MQRTLALTFVFELKKRPSLMFTGEIIYEYMEYCGIYLRLYGFPSHINTYMTPKVCSHGRNVLYFG